MLCYVKMLKLSLKNGFINKCIAWMYVATYVQFGLTNVQWAWTNNCPGWTLECPTSTLRHYLIILHKIFLNFLFVLWISISIDIFSKTFEVWGWTDSCPIGHPCVNPGQQGVHARYSYIDISIGALICPGHVVWEGSQTVHVFTCTLNIFWILSKQGIWWVWPGLSRERCWWLLRNPIKISIRRYRDFRWLEVIITAHWSNWIVL